MSERWVKATFMEWYRPDDAKEDACHKVTQWVNIGGARRIKRRTEMGVTGTYIDFDRMDMGPFEEPPEYFLGAADAAGIARMARHFGEKK